MCMEIRKFYAVRVENLKPICWQEATETFEPDELVYLVNTEVKRVVLADVGICITPQNIEAAEH